jgi:signal transduction histidine kinase
MNLCTNAYEAVRDGGGTVTIGLRHIEPHVELRVSDTGPGMDSATLERIFEPFFTTRAPGEGSGLGLCIVKQVAESFGATIAVDSQVGAGTTVRILFRAASS